jgi:hypothetical protein
MSLAKTRAVGLQTSAPPGAKLDLIVPSMLVATPAMYDAPGLRKGVKEGDIFRRAVTAQGCQKGGALLQRDCHVQFRHMRYPELFNDNVAGHAE